MKYRQTQRNKHDPSGPLFIDNKKMAQSGKKPSIPVPSVPAVIAAVSNTNPLLRK